MYRAIDLLDAAVDNCPDELWDKEYGGYVYWRLIYHTLASVWLFLARDGFHGNNTELFTSTAGMLSDEYKDKTPDKGVLKRVAEEARNHVKVYFDSIDESILDTEVSFRERKVTVAELIVSTTAHMMYHVGACDAALRDNGGKSVFY